MGAVGTGREDMSEPVAKDLNEAKELREVIDALRADNGRLLRLLIAGFVSDARPEHKELTKVLTHHPKLRNLNANQNQITQREDSDKSSVQPTTIKARHRRGRRGKGKMGSGR